MIMRNAWAAGAACLLLTACATPPDCTPTSGFELGRDAQPALAACPSSDYAEAWRLGQTLGDLEREQAALETQDGQLSPAQAQRLRVLQREIPELETLARLRALMPAAELEPTASSPVRQ